MNEIDKLIVDLSDEKESSYRFGITTDDEKNCNYDIIKPFMISIDGLDYYDVYLAVTFDKFLVNDDIKHIIWLNFATHRLLVYKIIELIYIQLKYHPIFSKTHIVLIQQLTKTQGFYHEWVDLVEEEKLIGIFK